MKKKILEKESGDNFFPMLPLHVTLARRLKKEIIR